MVMAKTPICPIVELEFLYSVRSLADRMEKQRLIRELFGWVPMPEGVYERADEVQQLLTEAGAHQSAAPVDLLIAATAERERLIVLCDDHDFRTSLQSPASRPSSSPMSDPGRHLCARLMPPPARTAVDRRRSTFDSGEPRCPVSPPGWHAGRSAPGGPPVRVPSPSDLLTPRPRPAAVQHWRRRTSGRRDLDRVRIVVHDPVGRHEAPECSADRLVCESVTWPRVQPESTIPLRSLTIQPPWDRS